MSTVNAGFAPLVGEGALNGGMPLAGAFSGRLDGRGRMIRDLFIDAERLGVAGGLFWAVDGGEIVATGLENVYARSAESAGAFAALRSPSARAEGLWARGEVVGAEGAVGGLFGVAEGGDIVDSWFAGEVYGAADAGGLIGVARAASAANVWTAAQVAGGGDVGGAFGRADSVTVRGAFRGGRGGRRARRARGRICRFGARRRFRSRVFRYRFDRTSGGDAGHRRCEFANAQRGRFSGGMECRRLRRISDFGGATRGSANSIFAARLNAPSSPTAKTRSRAA